MWAKGVMRGKPKASPTPCPCKIGTVWKHIAYNLQNIANPTSFFLFRTASNQFIGAYGTIMSAGISRLLICCAGYKFLCYFTILLDINIANAVGCLWSRNWKKSGLEPVVIHIGKADFYPSYFSPAPFSHDPPLWLEVRRPLQAKTHWVVGL